MIQYYPSLSQVAEWPSLEKGDLVDIVAPAWKCRPAEFRGALRFLRELGLEPRFDKKIFSNQFKDFSQSDEERFRQLKRAILASDSKLIWCVRGGYGAIRLVEELAKVKAPRKPKLFIGYSDITTLHQFMNGRWKWPTIHGPLLDRFGRKANLPRETKETLNLIYGRSSDIEFNGLMPLNSLARANVKIRSSVVGGNLAVLQSSFGTDFNYFPNDHIVFFEDIGERPHRLDRMLTQMRQAGYFKKARAVIFGSLLVSDVKDRRGIENLVLPRFAQEIDIPVLSKMPCGHGRVQRPLPFLRASILNLGRNPSLTIVGDE